MKNKTWSVIETRTSIGVILYIKNEKLEVVTWMVNPSQKDRENFAFIVECANDRLILGKA